MKVAIATNSSEKIAGILEAVSDYFQVDVADIVCYHKAVNSGVPEQPFNEETYVGALNRVNTLCSLVCSDIYVSCEAGIESFTSLYFNVQVVCVYIAQTQNYLWGKSSGWAVPAKDIEEVKERGLDDYLRNTKGVSAITEVFGDKHSRQASIREATWLALCSAKLT